MSIARPFTHCDRGRVIRVTFSGLGVSGFDVFIYSFGDLSTIFSFSFVHVSSSFGFRVVNLRGVVIFEVFFHMPGGTI